MDPLMILLFGGGAVLGVGKQVGKRLQQGSLACVHAIDTRFARLRQVERTSNEYKRRSPFKKSNGQAALIISFKGDQMASDRDDFARVTDEVVVNCGLGKVSAVVVRIESMGGAVFNYGIVFSQMVRIREACDKAGILLYAIVGTGALSGGYMAAAPAHVIIAPPFTGIGSVGVVTEFLNFHKLLEKWGITAVSLFAGDFKRTLTQFSNPDDAAAKAHVKEQLETMHAHFRALVTKYRPNIDVEKYLNGDHFLATDVLGVLVDRIGCYEDFLLELNYECDIVHVDSTPVKKMPQALSRFVSQTAARTLVEVLAAVGPKF